MSRDKWLGLLVVVIVLGCLLLLVDAACRVGLMEQCVR